MAIPLNGVMETLLITLYARAKDAAQPNPIINDQRAAQMVANIDYDFSKFESGIMSYYGVLSRAKIMDNQARRFIKENPDCVIVSVGCGLDTRFFRVDNGQITWYDLDFPEVIAQRNLFFEPHPRVKNIAKSALDPTWPQEIETNGKKLLIISEGVLMYLEEAQVKSFLEILTDGFDSFEAQFDLLYRGAVKKEKLHDTLKKTNAKFTWGVKDGSEVTALCPKLVQTGLINFTDEMKHHLTGALKLLTPIIYINNNRLGIYRFDKDKH